MMRSTMLVRALGRRSIPPSLIGINPSSMALSTMRRKRVMYDPYPIPQGFSGSDRGGLMKAYTHSQESNDEYVKMASLSPWVPVPDLVARRMLEIAEVGSDDIHVELGSGDGRVNFHARNAPFQAKKTIGLDIDENLVGLANDRLERIHPKPSNVIFQVVDLERTDAWLKHIEEATVITMYFVKDALIKLKPKLEAALKDRKCRIVCCGYEMPGWEARWVELIADLPVFMYTYNTTIEGIPVMTEQEMNKVMADLNKDAPPSLLDEAPSLSKWDDVPLITPPLWDPEEEVDYHWDKFDQPVETDVNGEPLIWWKKLE